MVSALTGLMCISSSVFNFCRIYVKDIVSCLLKCTTDEKRKTGVYMRRWPSFVFHCVQFTLLSVCVCATEKKERKQFAHIVAWRWRCRRRRCRQQFIISHTQQLLNCKCQKQRSSFIIHMNTINRETSSNLYEGLCVCAVMLFVFALY